MATSNPFYINVPAARSPRNAFNVGYSTLFSSPVGLLLPAYVENVKAGDKIKLSLSSVTRTRPVNTAAFQSFDEKIDFWFCPSRLIWSDYPYWKLAQMSGNSSLSLKNPDIQTMLPTTTWASISKWFENHNDYTIPNVSILSNFSLSYALRLLDLLNYSVPKSLAVSYAQDDVLSFDDSSTTDTLENFLKYYSDCDVKVGSPFNYFRLAAFQCIYMHHYRNEEFETFDPSYYNVDNLLLSSTTPKPKPNNTGNPGSDTQSGVRYLSASVDGRTLISSNPLSTQLTLSKLFAPRYKNWRRDLFTSLRPDPLTTSERNGLAFDGLGSNSSLSGDSFLTPGSILNSDPVNKREGDVVSGYSDAIGEYSFIKTPYFPYQSLYTHLAEPARPGDNPNFGSTRLYPQQIYNVLAMDKFARRSLYADKNYKEQMRVLFGIDAPEPNVPRYLGSHSSTVQINEIVASASGEANFGSSGTSKSVLGEIAGKGFQSSNGYVFDDTFTEDGIIIGVHYLMPRNNYDSYRVNKFNQLSSRFDYYFPDFDNLGLSPVFASQLNNSQIIDSVHPVPGTTLLGFSSRYYEYKDRQNEVHGVFMTGQVDNNWTFSNNSRAISFSSSPYNFKILPFITDSIFSLSYQGSQHSDPFMCYYNFDVTRVSNLSAEGVPSF